jgi:prephenate dehydratase
VLFSPQTCLADTATPAGGMVFAVVGAVAELERSLIEKLRAIAMEHLTKVRKLVSHPHNVEQTRAVLAEHFGTFKLEPERTEN